MFGVRGDSSRQASGADAGGGMKFLEHRAELSLYKSRTHGPRAERQVTLELALVVDRLIAAGLPSFLGDAWNSMQPGSSVCLIELDREVESQNLRFFDVADPERPAWIELKEANLAELRLEKQDSGMICLFFKVVRPLTKTLWDWMYHAESTGTLYAEFQECQTELPMAKAQTARLQ